jgi:hypothetical protein
MSLRNFFLIFDDSYVLRARDGSGSVSKTDFFINFNKPQAQAWLKPNLFSEFFKLEKTWATSMKH